MEADGKMIGGGVVMVALAIGGGTYLGWTVEPEGATECRIDLAVCESDRSHLIDSIEAQVDVVADPKEDR